MIIIDTLTIDIDRNYFSNGSNNSHFQFPFQFVINFKSKNKQVSIHFIKMAKDDTYPISSSKIYKLDKPNKIPVEFKIDDSNEEVSNHL